MNSIYKVIWSKAKNCYVVASEIARSHTKSATGSEKIGGVTRRSLLASLMALSLLCGGLGAASAVDVVHVDESTTSTTEVYTKGGTESYVNQALTHFDTKTEVDNKIEAKIEALTTTGDVATNSANITELQRKTQKIDYDVANDTTSVNGMKVGQQVDMGGKNITNVGTINGIELGTKEGGDFISSDGSIWGNMKNVDTQVGKNLVAIAENKAAITALDTKVGTVGTGDYLDPTKSVGENLGLLDAGLKQEVADRTAADSALSDRIGTVTDDGNYIKKSATNNVSENLSVLDGELAKTNDRTGGITRNADDTKTTIEGKVTVDKDGNVGGVKDLTVDGKLNVGEIYLEHKKLEPTGKDYDSATSIKADGISNRAKVTDENGNTTESKFTHNEKGTFNYAKDEKFTGEWKGATSNVTADGLSNKMTDSDGNTHTYYQTATETKEQLVNGDKSNFEKKTAEGNTISIKDKDAAGNDKSLTNKQTVDGEKTSVTNNESSSTINQGADQIRHNVTSAGKESSIEVKADGITNTSKDGTITNDAKDIVNNATGDMTNTVGGDLTTTVTGQATENFNGGLDTNVTGKENHTVTGDQNIHVTGKQTNEIGGDQVNTIGGNQTTTVTGDISNTAKNITNEATTKLTDKVGANTRVLDGEGITDTVPGAGGKGSTFRQRIDAIMGNVKTDAGESEMTQTGDEITSVVGKGEATNSRVTQKKGSLEAAVTDGTNTNVSYDVADASAKKLTDGTKVNKLQDNLDSSEKTITNGTYTTSKLQTALDITNTAKDGTITNDAKNIVNNASGDMTNTVGGKLTTTVTGATEENYTGGLTTNVTGEENHTVTGKQNNKVTGKQTNIVEGGQENIISGGQTNTITGGQINNITGDQTTTITGNKTETVEGKVTEKFNNGQETTVTGDQDIHVTENQTNTIDGNQANTIGGDQTTNVTGDISNMAENITNAANNTLTDKVGDNTRVITSRSITDTVGAANRMIEDGKITDNAGDFTVTTDEENGTTFTNAGSTAASSFTTVDGTNTGSAQEWTNIKGNEISTGKVEANYVKMDYADVMHDLGVHGSATVDNDLTVKGITTTKTLKVTENATVGGTLDVTKKATFHDDVDITKNLSVGGNATITGDVTANSYKVGDKTYISAAGINANNQKITNVADGSISEGSKDAVNGGQLYGVKRDLEHQVDKVGANAAAMANLRPMEFDPSSKWNIAAAIGNYGSETAAALGAFYRPNDDVMVNLSTAFGTGENMVGGGVSVRLGKGGNKLSREETNALKAQVADLSARMDALLSVLNPNMSKDFPDVPENHWAYEAVSRLAGNDIVQGYPDGEFHGERTMTRYEMAEIIYNALSRGAEAEKELVEEFKPELQAMAASEKATAERAEG